MLSYEGSRIMSEIKAHTYVNLKNRKSIHTLTQTYLELREEQKDLETYKKKEKDYF